MPHVTLLFTIELSVVVLLAALIKYALLIRVLGRDWM